MSNICIYNGCTKNKYSSSDFCSRTHALQYSQISSSANTTPTPLSPTSTTTTTTTTSNSNQCKLPGCSFNKLAGFDFCCKSHGVQFNQSKVFSLPQISATNKCNLQSCSNSKYPGYDFCSRNCGLLFNSSKSSNICKLDGCLKSAQVGFDFCSRDHGREYAATKCKLNSCNKKSHSGFEFCCKQHGIEYNNSLQPVTILDKNDPKYQSIEEQFRKKWKHSNTSYRGIHQILKIRPAKHIIDRYEKKKQLMESRGSFSTQLGYKGELMSPGNEQRRFHGTNIACSLGLNGCTTICTSQQCVICRIIDVSFILPTSSSTKHNWSRFGKGIYFSSTSSKSNDYCQSLNGNPYKYMFVAHVLVGKGEKVHVDNPNLTSPSPGYDSVLGEIGVNLNYDEIMVYSVDQAKPGYLIIYN